MEIKYWAGTDVGRKRSDNEDNFLIDKRLKLFVVADGMGGHASGEIASAVAVHGIREIIDRERDILDTYDDDDPKCHVEVCTLLEYAVHHTCESIFKKARREPEKRGMGTTLVVLLIIGARGFIAYVGDSRIYLLRGGIVYQLTEDHSLKNELIRMGKITADEFDSSPYANLKNAMTRAVGVYETVEVDTLDFDIIPGDSFLLCSDGLYEYLSDDDIAHAIGLTQIREVPGMLIDAANSRGGKDNITAVVVQVAGDDDDGDRAAELNFTLDTLKNVPLFRELSYQQLVRVMNLAKQNAVVPGQQLFSEGEPGNELLVVLKGRIELTRDGVGVAELSAGAHLGEMSLIDAGTRSATAKAVDPGKVLVITRDDFYDVLRREPALAVKLLWSFVRVLAQRLRATTADLASARSTVAQQFPDLTALAEDAAKTPSRLAIIEPDPDEGEVVDADDLLEEDDEDDLRSSGMVSGTLRQTKPDLGAIDESQLQDPVIPKRRATLISTTTNNPERSPSDAPVPRPSSDPAARGNTVVAPAARPPSGPAPAAGISASGRPPSGPVPSASAPRPPSRPVPSATPRPRPPRGPVPSAVMGPRPPSGPVNTGDTVVPPSARPRPPSGPANTGDTVVPPSARPRPPSGPANTGSTVVPPSARPRPPSGPANTGSTVARPPAGPRPATTGDTVVPPSATTRGRTEPANLADFAEPSSPRPRRDPDVTRPLETAMWPPPETPVAGEARPTTAPLEIPSQPSSKPDLDADAPAPRARRRATLPQAPGTPVPRRGPPLETAAGTVTTPAPPRPPKVGSAPPEAKPPTPPRVESKAPPTVEPAETAPQQTAPEPFDLQRSTKVGIPVVPPPPPTARSKGGAGADDSTPDADG